MKKETKIEISIIIVLVIILGILMAIAIKELNPNNIINDRDVIRQEFGNPNEEKTEKETKTSDVNAGQEVLNSNIDLSQYNSNITITKAGEYTLVYTMGSSVGGDAGIDTDEGFELNGGTVIVLGADMLEKPEKTSKQKSVCFTLNSKISKGTKITLKSELDEEVISFEAKEDFKTLIISNSKLTSGTYYLYVDGEKTNYTTQAE